MKIRIPTNMKSSSGEDDPFTVIQEQEPELRHTLSCARGVVIFVSTSIEECAKFGDDMIDGVEIVLGHDEESGSFFLRVQAALKGVGADSANLFNVLATRFTNGRWDVNVVSTDSRRVRHRVEGIEEAELGKTVVSLLLEVDQGCSVLTRK